MRQPLEDLGFESTKLLAHASAFSVPLPETGALTSTLLVYSISRLFRYSPSPQKCKKGRRSAWNPLPLSIPLPRTRLHPVQLRQQCRDLLPLVLGRIVLQRFVQFLDRLRLIALLVQRH